MKRCAAYVPRKPCASGLAYSGRRWTSHSRDSLTDEALLAKVGARLNDDEYGKKITLDAKNKTISSEGKELPMSPLFDPAWIKSRRRKAKAPQSQPSGVFKTRLYKNPFAHALDSPIRWCPITKTYQPRYFLQRFDVVQNPETEKAWMVPANDDYKHIQRNNEFRANGAPAATGLRKDGQGGPDEEAPRLTGYVVSQKSIFDAMSDPKTRLHRDMLGRRSGMCMGPGANAPVWRHDMNEVVLRNMRREATSELIQRARVEECRFVEPCAGWEDIRDVERRGCVLWLPRGKNRPAARQHATFDVENVKYNSKMPVHDLFWVLGEEEAARLQSESAVFRDNELLVLKSWPTKTAVQLHMLLWKIHGYLDIPTS